MPFRGGLSVGSLASQAATAPQTSGGAAYGEVEAFQFGRVQGHALGGDEAGVDVVGGDALVAQLDGQDPGGLEQAGLADRVADAVAAHVERVGVGHARGHVEDGPLAPLDHAGDEQLDEGQWRHDVDVDLFPQIGQLEVQHRGLGALARCRWRC